MQPKSTAPVGSGASGGGLLGGPNLIEVRGYVLAHTQSVPDKAIGYGVPIFTARSQAARFCPAFLSQLSFAGALISQTPTHVRSYGHVVEVAPFVWPVTSWKPADRPNCSTLVARYDLSGARTFFDLAQRSIRAGGGAGADQFDQGPFIMTARRVSGEVMMYDMTHAPDGDYERWMRQSITDLSNPAITSTALVKPSVRDQIRFYVFAAMPTWQGVLDLLVPGWQKEHAKG